MVSIEVEATPSDKEGRSARKTELKSELDSALAKNKKLKQRLVDTETTQLALRRRISELEKQTKDLQSKFDREANEHWDCFRLFKRDFKENPMLAWNFANQFEYHLRNNMQQQGLVLGPRIGHGGFGVSYKACIRTRTSQYLCVKVPRGLKRQNRSGVAGSLKEEITYLNLVHKRGGTAEADQVLDCIVKPLMTHVRLFQNEPVLVMKYYDRNMHELYRDLKVTVSDL